MITEKIRASIRIDRNRFEPYYSGKSKEDARTLDLADIEDGGL